VAADTTVVVRFSEPMEDAGEIDLVGVVRSDELTWNATNDELTFVPPALPEGPVEVRLNGFADVAGNALFPHAFSFDVARSAPLVTASSPAEGATDVSGRVGTITIEFSRGMDVSVGTVSAVEGGATVLGMRWTSTRALEVSVDVLAYETTHRFALEGFTDRAGNALDATSYLEDGHLDFTTSADTDAPRVAEATPNEGTLDVDDGATTEIVLVFDEPMAEAGTATLVVDGTETVLDATWSDPRTLTLDVVGLLRGDAEHRVRLEGLTDVAGNALDGAPVLVDGALDFVTGRDVAEPFVRISDPVEGSDNVGWRRDVIRLELSEAMDTSITDVTIDDGVAPFVVTGTWSMGDSVLTLDVTGRLAAATSYRVDLRGLMDAGGTPLDADHPYLGDGALDFVGDQPTGENCRDAVTTAEATTTDGVHRWAFPEASIAFADGGASTCGVNGSPPADGVIRYTKTTGDLASGGTALRIRAEGVGNLLQERLTVQVFAGVCEPTVALATPGTELKCVSGRQVQEQYLDLPAGDYYVWFSSGGSTTAFFYGGTIELEEVAAVPEGESCVDPLDRTSAQYVAPSAAGEAESWLLTTGSMTGYDVGVVAGTDEIACDARTGPDAVIEVQKASATSVLRIHAEGDAENTTSMDFSLDLRTTCDGGEEDSVLCEYSIAPRADGARYFRGPAGTYYLWVAAEFYSIDFPTVRVSVQEIEPAAGESCATALPLTVGTTNAVSPGSTRTVDHPSCAEATDALTWYRFTATTRHTRLRSNTGALVATAHVAGARELDCREGAESRDATVFSEIGDEICVAVATDAGVTSLELEAMAYEGVAGAPTVLPFTLPINPSNGETLNPGTLYWVGLTPTTLYSNNAQVGVLTGPVAGGVMEYLQDGLGFEELGYAAVVVGEQLFVLEEQQRSGATGRVRRVIDTMGRLNPVEWDTGSAY
ncbi:MAG: Ig-like domain-containing protein, partial [Myxococcales bacterium]|nr:Ig-like domain-containing protein [Myxococcales bacterium]